MDICLNTDKLASEDLNNYYELVVDPAQLICGFSGELPVNDLGKDLTKLLNLEDGENSVSGSIPASGNDGVGEVPICEDFQFSKSTNEKVLKRSATFPCSNNGMSPTAALTCENEEKTEDRVDNIPSEVLEQNGHVTSDATPSRSLSLPVPSKLVSALKGSREKHGVPLKKLTVTWAPDVYDPTPTAVSHVVTNKSQRHRSDNKRNSKNKQKGTAKPSRSSRGKEKKQSRKYGGSSSRCFKSLDNNERMVDQVHHRSDIVDYSIGNPDPYCGSSFLKNSVSELHFSVAEAT